MSENEINKLIWLNYAQALKTKCGANLGSGEAFFVASEATPSLVSRVDVPVEYINRSVYHACNNLITGDNLLYTPLGQRGYAQALHSCLNWNSFQDGNYSQHARENLMGLGQRTESYQRSYDQVLEKYLNFYIRDCKMGYDFGQKSFGDWARSNAPRFSATSKQLKDSLSFLQQVQGQLLGHDAGRISSDREKLVRGLNVEQTHLSPEYNMPGAAGNARSPRELWRLSKDSERVQQPNHYSQPRYDVPELEQFLQNASQPESADAYAPNDWIGFDLESHIDTSKFDLGQTDVKDDKFSGWLSFKADKGESLPWISFEPGNGSPSIAVKILFDKLSLLKIQPGPWDIRTFSYVLRPDAPSSVKLLFRPTQLVVATRLGYEISYNDPAAHGVEKFFSRAQAEGTINVLGLAASLSGSKGDSAERHTHEVHFDKSAKKIRVAPKDNACLVTPIALVGEKLIK